jgi:lipid II:glycine glycyltransferase (peptidoglycan interpeptide bridge formation enzyme)
MQSDTDQIESTGLAAPSSPRPDEGPASVSPSAEANARWEAWDRFLEATPETGFMQSSWWVEFRNACDFDNFALTLKDGNDLVGGAVVLKYTYAPDRCFYYIQDGPVLPSDPDVAEEVFRIVVEGVEERRWNEPETVSHLRIEPRWLHLPGFVSGFRPIRPLADIYLEARDTRCIDLRPAEAAILAQMRPKGRYNIGVARRHGVSIVEDTSKQGLADFLSIYDETTSRHGMNPKPSCYFEMLLSSLVAAQRGSLFFAEYRGMRVATVLVVYFGNRATYFFGGSRHNYRTVMAPYLLHFEIMCQARARGHEWYDLWGIAPPNEPDHPWQNISAFKAKFGGVEVRLVPTLDYVYDAAAYADYVTDHQESHESVKGESE